MTWLVASERRVEDSCQGDRDWMDKNWRVDQGRWPWVVGEMGVAEGVAMPMNSVMEL